MGNGLSQNGGVALSGEQVVVHGDVAGRDIVRQQIDTYVKDQTIIQISDFTALESVPPAEGHPPYKGLTYFTEQDREIFFGRQSLTDELVTRLQSSKFLAVIGASGSGKSSVARAGIVPQLRHLNWLIHIITPTTHPLHTLANSLTQDDLLADVSQMKQALLANPHTLSDVAGKLASRENKPFFLLVVDQFEELFILAKDSAEQTAFVDSLVQVVNNNGQAAILLLWRSDFLARYDRFPQLAPLLEQNQALVLSMNSNELLEAVIEPAKRGGWKFAEGLVEQILEDVGDEPGRLPLLSHALRETWERRRGHIMTLSGYREAGGVKGAIAETAEKVFLSYSPAEQELVKQTFLTLTELGEGAEDTRRIAEREELIQIAQDERSLEKLLQGLVGSRLITIGDEGTVQVAHEALIRRWPRLQRWLTENRSRLRFERQVNRDAQEWERLGQDSGVLYRGARLAQAVEWGKDEAFTLTTLAQNFVETSQSLGEKEQREREAARRKELRQTRLLAMSAGIVALLVLGIALYRPALSWFLARTYQSELIKIDDSLSIEPSEVTNEQYRACVQAQRCDIPQDPTQGYFPEEEMGSEPIVGISAYQANDYCFWLGRQLPTTNDWELVSESHNTKILNLENETLEWSRSFAKSELGSWDGSLQQLCFGSIEKKDCTYIKRLQHLGWEDASGDPFTATDYLSFRCVTYNK